MHCDVLFQQNVSNHLLCTLNPSQHCLRLCRTDEAMEIEWFVEQSKAKRSIKAFSPAVVGLTQLSAKQKNKRNRTHYYDGRGVALELPDSTNSRFHFKILDIQLKSNCRWNNLFPNS